MARYPFQLVGHPIKLTRNPPDVGRNYSHIVQNLECRDLCDDGRLVHESIVKFDEGGAEVLYFLVDLASDILQRPLP